MHGRIAETLGDVQLGAVRRIAQLLAERRQVVLRIENLQVCDQRGTLVHQVHPPPQQIACLTHALGVGIRQREVAPLEQMRDFVRIDPVVLGLAAVDQLHVQRVADHERDRVLGTAVGEPVPAEHALHTDDDTVAEGGKGLQQRLEMARQVAIEYDGTGTVQDANVHGPGVQVDAAVESMWAGIVEAHHGLPTWVGA